MIATAIHDGHALRDELRNQLALSDEDRKREEDPHTGRWTTVAPTRVVVQRSRFEVDLNRPRDQAIYRLPSDAWGLQVWKEPLAPDQVDRSLELYDAFYNRLASLLDDTVQREGGFVVLDLHSYNHRRAGPNAPPDDPRANPEINIGTGTMDRARWGEVVDALLASLSGREVLGRRLDVRENIKFQGGQMTRWIHENHPEEGCSLAIEFKKLFMDEWTGEVFEPHHRAIEEALRASVPAVVAALRKVRPEPSSRGGQLGRG